VKFCSYFPYNAKLCLNGHEWAKRQAAKAGIGFTALDNGFAAVDDVAALQAICHRLGPQQIDALLRKWLARLPHPFSLADRAAGYRYELSILQAEFSLTQMLDRPVSGRVFFEQVIRDNLDIGRPDQVSLVFDRRMRRRGPRATASTACTPPCSSPPSTTDSSPPALRSSPTTQAHPHFAKPPAPTTQLSKTSPVQQVSPHNSPQRTKKTNLTRKSGFARSSQASRAPF